MQDNIPNFFRDLFEYNFHFNQKLSDLFLAHRETLPDDIKRVFCHILNAHQIWNNRINPVDKPFGVWTVHDLTACKSIDQVNFEQTSNILDKRDLQETIAYKTSKGQPFVNTLRDVLFHVINHATYHRGQIATAFRKNGIEPLPTDYIFYRRR